MLGLSCCDRNVVVLCGLVENRSETGHRGSRLESLDAATKRATWAHFHTSSLPWRGDQAAGGGVGSAAASLFFFSVIFLCMSLTDLEELGDQVMELGCFGAPEEHESAGVLFGSLTS